MRRSGGHLNSWRVESLQKTCHFTAKRAFDTALNRLTERLSKDIQTLLLIKLRNHEILDLFCDEGTTLT